MSQKQGLSYLRQQAHLRGFRAHLDQKTIIIPIYSFINQLITSLKSFLNNSDYHCWCDYFIDQHFEDRLFANLIKSWQKLVETSLQCHLLQSLLTVRNKNKIKLYLKARKYITQTAAQKSMLDEILLTLQDAITIIHKLFVNEQIRKALIQGMRNIFMAFKMSEAKIYSSVLIEYLLAVYDSVFKLEYEQATISGQFSSYGDGNNRSISYFKSSNQNYVELFSSISNFQSEIHNQNGLYKKNNTSNVIQKKYQIIEKKFLPLKETSQFVSNVESNKFSSGLSKQNGMRNFIEREKSSFYEFIVQNNSQHKEKRSLSREENDLNSIRNCPKSFERNSISESQKKFYQQKRQAQHKHAQRPTNDRENDQSPFQKKSIARQRQTQTRNQPFTHSDKSKFPSKFTLKQSNPNQSKISENKNFSLDWFSKKFFQTQNEINRQSILHKSKAKLKKDYEQKQKQRFNSTQSYEIENQLMMGPSFVNQQKQKQEISRQQEEESVQKEDESVKSEEFQKMVQKNQQFKEKMLKKSMNPSFASGNKGSQSQKEMILESSRFQIKDDRISKSKIQLRGGRQMNVLFQNTDLDDSQIIKVTSHFGQNGNKKTSIQVKRLPFSPEKDVYQEQNSYSLMKQKMQRIAQSYGNLYQSKMGYREYENEEDQWDQGHEDYEDLSTDKFVSSSIKNNHNKQPTQKPQIIHKSITQNKRAHLYSHPTTNQPSYPSYPSNHPSPQQSPYYSPSHHHQQQRTSPTNVNRMKSLLHIIDDYRQNADNQKAENQFSISESFCKKSRFGSQFHTEGSETMHNYSFEAV